MNEFHSEYADVVYIKRDNVVLLTWKKRAIIDCYREPTTFALKLLQENENSNFVVDARNGFEDDKSDVEWGFTFLLPKMAETTCKFVGFVMDEENEIGEEMDMWTNPFEQKRYSKTAHYIVLTERKAKYVENVCISCYEIKTI